MFKPKKPYRLKDMNNETTSLPILTIESVLQTADIWKSAGRSTNLIVQLLQDRKYVNWKTFEDFCETEVLNLTTEITKEEVIKGVAHAILTHSDNHESDVDMISFYLGYGVSVPEDTIRTKLNHYIKKFKDETPVPDRVS